MKGLAQQVISHTKTVLNTVEQIYARRRAGPMKREELRAVRFGDGPEKEDNNLSQVMQSVEKVKSLFVQNNASARPHFVDTFTYNQALLMYCKLGYTLEGLELCEEMTAKHVQPDNMTYNLLLIIFAREGAEEAFKVYRKMSALDIELDPSGCRALIDAYLSKGLEKEAVELFKEMREMYQAGARGRDDAPNRGKGDGKAQVIEVELTREQRTAAPMFLMHYERVVQDLINSHEKSVASGAKTGGSVKDSKGRNQLEQARYLFESMKQLGLAPTFQTYLALVHGYAQGAKTKEVLSLLEEMKTLGLNLDAPLYNLIIKMYAEEEIKLEEGAMNNASFTKHSNQAVGMFNEMAKAKIAPNVETYNILIEMYAKLARFEASFEPINQAHLHFQEMKEHKLEPDAKTYSCLIACFWLRQQFHIAFAYRAKEARDSQWTVEEMRARRVEPVPALIRQVVHDEDLTDAKIAQFVEKLFGQAVDVRREEFLIRQKEEETRRETKNKEEQHVETINIYGVRPDIVRPVTEHLTRAELDHVMGVKRKTKEEKKREYEVKLQQEKREAKLRAQQRQADQQRQASMERMGIYDEPKGLPERMWAQEEAQRREKAEKERLRGGGELGARHMSKSEREELEIREARKSRMREIEGDRAQYATLLKEEMDRVEKEKELRLLAQILEYERKEAADRETLPNARMSDKGLRDKHDKENRE